MSVAISRQTGRRVQRAGLVALALGALISAACGQSSNSSAGAATSSDCDLLSKCPLTLEYRLCPTRIVDANCKPTYASYLQCLAKYDCAGDAAAPPASDADGGTSCAAQAQAFQFCRAGVDAG